MENGKGIEMVFRKRLLCILTYLMITTEGSLAYKSGCKGGYCFILSEFDDVDERTTQEEAQRWCFNNGSQLIEIQNQSIQAALTSFLDTQYDRSDYIMTNGIRQSSNWTRLSGNSIGRISIIVDQTDASYAYLRPTLSGIRVYASKPAASKRYICSESQFNCTNGGVLIDEQCYKSYNETLSWYDARTRCLDGGGDLASFDNITTNSEFNALSGSLLSQNVNHWIGFRSERWTWNGTGDELLYNQWSKYDPWTLRSGDPMNCLCLFPYNPYQWTECTCSDRFQFLCMSGSTTTTIATKEDGRPTTFSMKNTPTTVTTSQRKETTQKNNSHVISDIDADKTEHDANTHVPMYLGVGLGVGVGLIFLIMCCVKSKS